MIPPQVGHASLVDDFLRRDAQSEGFSVGDIPTYLGAVGADMLTSTANSLESFLPDEVWEPTSTYNWLTEKGFVDVAEFYKRNKDAVQLGSFAGEVLAAGLGGGVVLGALKAGRLGALAARPFNMFENGVRKNQQRMLKLIEDGATDTLAYKQFRRRMAANQFGQAAVDSATYEAAFYALANEHEWMENYDWSNFGLGTGIGTLFGGGIRYWRGARDVALAGREIQTGQFAQAKVEEFIATEKMYGVEDAANAMNQRGRRIAARKQQLNDPQTQGAARQFLDAQDVRDVRLLIDEMTDFLPKGAVSSRGKIGPEVGQRYGVDQDYLDVLYRLNVNHPTGIALEGAKGLNWWADKAVDPFTMIGNRIKSPSDVHALWRSQQSRARGPVPANFQERAILDPRSGQSGLILPEATALTNLRAADDISFKLGSVKWKDLARPTDDLWSDANGIYKLQGTLSGDKNLMLTMNAQLPGRNAILALGKNDIYKMQRLVAEGEDFFNSQRVRALVIDGQQIRSHDELLQKYRQGKVDVAKQLHSEGYTQSQIATFVNMTDEDISKLANNRWAPDTDVSSWGLYTTNKTDLQKWLNQKQLVFQGDDLVQQRIRTQSPLTVMDRADQYTAHQSVIDNIMTNPATGPRTLDLYEQIISDRGFYDMTNHIEGFVSQLGTGGRKFGSADFALREFGHFGEFAASIGARQKDFVNKTVSDLNVGLAPIGREIQADRVQSAIWGQVYKAYTGLPSSLSRQTRWDAQSGHILIGADPLKIDGAVLQIDRNSAVGRWLTEWTKSGGANDTLAEFTDSIQRMKGFGNLSDNQQATGLYFPYPNLEDKFTAYIHNTSELHKSKLIVANSADELEQIIKNTQSSLRPGEHIVRRGDSADWAAVHGYHQEVGRLERFNPEQAKKGIQIEGVSPIGQSLDDILQGMHWEINGRVRSLVKNSNPYLMDSLQKISNFHRRGFASSNMFLPQSIRAGEIGRDPGTLLYNTMMNQSGARNFPLMHTLNNAFETGMNLAISKLNLLAESTIGKVTGKRLTEQDFDEVVRGLAEKNIPNPWASVDEFLAANYQPYRNLAPSTINTYNALAATLTLRLMEVAHGAVTLMSYPIAMMAGGSPMKHMMEGIRMQFGRDEFSRLVRERAAQHGFLDPKQYLFEQSNAYSAALGENKIRRALDSRLVQVLSAPSDWAEKATRHWAYFAGISQAAAKDPQMIDRMLRRGMTGGMDMGEHFAHAFTLRSMGNYNGTQRPLLFQGALGNAMMLYQTYMLTMGQNMFRFLERRDTARLAKLLGTQASTFGVASLPMYDYLNKQVGEHVVEDRFDITAMTNRIFGKDGPEERNWAEFILYGAPSAMMNTAFTSRAELQPRLPLAAGTDGSVGIVPPVISIAKQAYDLAATAANEIGGTINAGGGTVDVLQAASRALTMQSIWRPGRGMAELAQGYTLDRNGAVVENSAFHDWSNMTRAFGVRPLQEHVLRQSRYMNTYYDALDSNNRQQAVTKMREWAIRPDNGLDIGNIAAEYFENGGTSRGWQSALNRSFMEANIPLANRLQREVAGQPLLDDVVSNYIF